MRVIVLAALWATLAAVVLGYSAHREARLLRLDPGAIVLGSAPAELARALGRPLFETRCAGCHGARGRGDPGRGIPDMTDADWLYGSGSVGDIEQIVRYGIRSHHPKSWDLAFMPAYATPHPSARDPRIEPLTPGDIRDVVERLMQLQGSPSDAASAARGALIFLGRGACYDCHAADAKGDPAIGAPNLTDRITLYGDGSRESLRRSIAGGRHGMCPAWEGRLSAAAIREVSIFVYSLSHGGAAP